MKFQRERRGAATVFGVVGACLLLAACGNVPLRRQAAAQPGQAAAPATKVEDDLLAQLLAGEFALGRADLTAAAASYARAAGLSRDPAVAAHATRVALVAKDWTLARQSLNRWRALKPDDPGQGQVEASLAMSDGNAEAAYQALAKLLVLPDQQGWRLLGQVLHAEPVLVANQQAVQDLCAPPREQRAHRAGQRLGRRSIDVEVGSPGRQVEAAPTVVVPDPLGSKQLLGPRRDRLGDQHR